MDLYEINSIECETRCVPMNEEKEIKQQGDSKRVKTKHDEPNFSDTFIEKSKATQCLRRTSVLDLVKRCC